MITKNPPAHIVEHTRPSSIATAIYNSTSSNNRNAALGPSAGSHPSFPPPLLHWVPPPLVGRPPALNTAPPPVAALVHPPALFSGHHLRLARYPAQSSLCSPPSLFCFMHRPNHIKQSQKLKSKSAKHQKINNTQYETKNGRRGAEVGLSRLARKPEVVTGEEGRRADQGGDGWWRCVKGRRPAGQRRRHPVEQRRREGRMRAGLRSQGRRGSYNI